MWDAPGMAEALATRDVAAVFRFLQAEGVSQRRIATLTGQGQSEVSEVLRGRVVTSYPVLERVAVGLGIPRGRMGLAYLDSEGVGDDMPAVPTRLPAADGEAPPSPYPFGIPGGHGRLGRFANPRRPAVMAIAAARDGGSGSGTAADYWCYVLGTVAVFKAHKAASICAVLRASLRRRTDGMVTVVGRWTGLESRALREAMRMNFREFGAHLGVSPRMVLRWEAGGVDICPRPASQELFDTCLRLAPPDARQRFTATLEALLEALTTLEIDRAASSDLAAKTDAPETEPTAVGVGFDVPQAGQSIEATRKDGRDGG